MVGKDDIRMYATVTVSSHGSLVADQFFYRYWSGLRHGEVGHRNSWYRDIQTRLDHEGKVSCAIESIDKRIRTLTLILRQSLIPVVMSGIIAVYSLVIAVLIAGDMDPQGESYSLF